MPGDILKSSETVTFNISSADDALADITTNPSCRSDVSDGRSLVEIRGIILPSELQSWGAQMKQSYHRAPKATLGWRNTALSFSMNCNTTNDIVAVHGLNGDAYETWMHENGSFWLRDFLPGNYPGPRIFTFGYPSEIFTRSTGKLPDFARSLLEGLMARRRSHEVGHCYATY